MKLKEAYENYSYNNIGQFRALSETLGYKTEYHDGSYRFHKEGDSITLTMEEIRSKAKENRNDRRTEESKEKVCSFFDKNRANDPSYIKELRNKGISVVRWNDIKGENKDGVTIIDHNRKVCYTGQELYEYEHNTGNLLDGKGTKLEKGIMSDLMDIGEKKGKLRMSENGISVFYRKETLTIPDRMLGHKLNKTEKERLLHGDIVPLDTKKGTIMLQVDKDLNSVIVRSNKEIKIPNVIGKTNEYEGYKLTKADKYLLANGHTLESKLMHSKDGYILADISLTDDKKGIQFSNIQSITEGKAHELIKEMRPKLEVADPAMGNRISSGKERDMDSEFKEAVGSRDFEKIDKLREEGYKPSEEYIRGIGKELNLSDNEMKEIQNVFHVKPDELGERQKQAARLLEAASTSNFRVIQDIQKSGYKITQSDIKAMRENGVQENTLIAVLKIFGLENKGKTLGDVKLASSPKPDKTKEMARPIANTVNKMFNDL